jgi:hypothetical protein
MHAIISAVIPIQQFIPAALAAVLAKAPTTPEKVSFAWQAAVGTAVAHVTSVSLHKGVLDVVARDPAWQREVKRSTPVILARLKTLLGDAVTRINVRAASASDPSADGSNSVRRRR